MKLKFIKNICATLLIASFALMPVSKNFEAQRAEAVFGVADTVIEIGANLFNNILTQINSWEVWTKEFILDGITWAIINLLIEEMINDTTDWVAHGFEGDPMFVTDFGGFLLDVTDQAAGEFLLLDGPLEFLCSPFKLDIIGAIGAQYNGLGYGSRYYKPHCSISDAVGNLDDFLEGDFYSGGWNQWASMTLNPYGNVYGSTFGAQANLDISIRSMRGQEISLLDWGDGLFTDKECETVNGVERCINNTPGTTIEAALNNSLNTGNNRLSVADEIDELVGALLTQFVSKALDFAGTGNGLRGFKPSTEGGTVVPVVPDLGIESNYRNLVTKTANLIAEAQVFCSATYERSLPLSVQSIYDDLLGSLGESSVHTQAEVDALERQYSSLETQLDLYMANECI